MPSLSFERWERTSLQAQSLSSDKYSLAQIDMTAIARADLECQFLRGEHQGGVHSWLDGLLTSACKPTHAACRLLLRLFMHISAAVEVFVTPTTVVLLTSLATSGSVLYTH
jgi:hypothetical protein